MGKSSGDRFYEHLKDVLEGAKDKEAMGLFITLAAQIHSISLMAKKEKGTFGNEEIDNFFSPEQWLSCALEYEAKTSRFIENGLMVKSPYEKAYDAIMQEIVTDKSARTTLGLAKLILMLLYNAPYSMAQCLNGLDEEGVSLAQKILVAYCEEGVSAQLKWYANELANMFPDLIDTV